MMLHHERGELSPTLCCTHRWLRRACYAIQFDLEPGWNLGVQVDCNVVEHVKPLGGSGCWVLVVMDFVMLTSVFGMGRSIGSDWRALGRIEGSALCSYPLNFTQSCFFTLWESMVVLSKEMMERAVDVSKQ